MSHHSFSSSLSQHALLKPRRLLHVEASGSEVLIDHQAVRHVGSYKHVTQLKNGEAIVDRVGVFDGDLMPIIDIRAATGSLSDARDALIHDFLVLSLDNQLIGARVDRVIDILLIPAIDVDSSNAWRGRQADFIIGLVSLRNKRLPLVDMRRLLAPASAMTAAQA